MTLVRLYRQTKPRTQTLVGFFSDASVAGEVQTAMNTVPEGGTASTTPVLLETLSVHTGTSAEFLDSLAVREARSSALAKLSAEERAALGLA